MNSGISLTDKVALITGAGGAIGSATCQLLAARGARIVAVDRDAAALQRLAHELGTPSDSSSSNPRWLGIQADVTDEHAVSDYVRRACAVMGRIDILFNNAGIEGNARSAWCLLPDLALEDFNAIISVNINGVFLGMKHVIPTMVKQGCGVIINAASICGSKGTPGQAAYVASKHAVVGMTRTAAMEWSHLGVRVNCIAPGAIESRMMQDFTAVADPGDKLQLRENFLARLPARRYGSPREVAALVAFLASEDAGYITGACYAIDGGLTAM